MQLTKFGRTGMSVSRLCLGTATFGKQTEEDLAVIPFNPLALDGELKKQLDELTAEYRRGDEAR